ncbi:MAG: folylpolyglutamate synthase/dihydrofolate synthase family protein [Caulobacterales bacterium]
MQPLRDALAKLGDPQNQLPLVIHVAGTNGKGSTIAFLRAVIEAAGLTAHVFSKPHLIHLNERLRIAGELVSDDALITAADRVKHAGENLSQFEAQVASAFLLFSQTRADYVLLETGFGGRDDATNVIAAPRLCVITPIDLDHQAVLGETRAEIATHKAGIIKPGALTIAARQYDEALSVLEAAADRARTPLLLCGREWDAFARQGRLIVQTDDRLLDLPTPSLEGAHQIENAGLAVMAALTLNDTRITEDAIAAGVSRADWPARLQPVTSGALANRVIAAGGELWLDGGHNPHAARALAAALHGLNRRAPRETIAIIALRARKDAEGFIAALAPALSRLIVIPLSGDTSANPTALVEGAQKLNMHVQHAASLDDALNAALQTKAPRILVTGSLLLAGEILAAT